MKIIIENERGAGVVRKKGQKISAINERISVCFCFCFLHFSSQFENNTYIVCYSINRNYLAHITQLLENKK